MSIKQLDHLVLTVKDSDATCRFYADHLGMDVITFDDKRKALRFGNQKINLHPLGNEFEPKAAVPTCGSADLCFLSDTPLEGIMAELQQAGIEILEGPVKRTGATGPIRSIYLRDPDDNLIEIANAL
ncbi:MAG: VOC family protein [Gammaproteobacteria bacterium]|nr:VOC family protein [Gammaproteobacteria bacterium]